MGNCECGRLKGNPCGPLWPNTINVTMHWLFSVVPVIGVVYALALLRTARETTG